MHTSITDMNPLYLTKIAKHTLIGSLSAYLSFAGKANPNVHLFFLYTLGGIIAVFILAALWEAREYLTAQNPSEADLSTLMSGLTGQKPASRSYMLSPQARLEIVIALVVIIVCALVGRI